MIQEFAVTPGCYVWLEPWANKTVQLGIHAADTTAGACQAEALVFSDDRGSEAAWRVHRVIDSRRSLIIRVTPDSTLPAPRLENVAVASVAFDMNERGDVESGILAGMVRLTEWENVGDTLLLHDRLSMGETCFEGACGQLAQVVVGDTLEVVFRGTASETLISGRDLRLTRLEQLRRDERNIVLVGLVFGFMVLIVGFFETVLR